MSWVDYGFPYPVFRPVYGPAYALSLALIERYRVQKGITGEITVPDYFPSVFSRDHLISYNIDRSAFISEFNPLSSLSIQYINHLALKGSSPVVKLWTYSDLCTATEERDDSGVGILEGEDMRFKYPEYSVIWLKQRWIMLNLLKIAVIPVIVREGYGTSQGAATQAEAISAAYSGFYDFESGSTDFLTFRTYCYKPGSTWTCIMNQPFSIKINPTHYTGILTCPSYLYFVPQIEWSFGTLGAFDAHGTGVLYNQVSTLSIPYQGPRLPDTVFQPNQAHANGFLILGPDYNVQASTPYCGVDVSSLFEFYENVDEIPTP
jgi:hypothetical protein